jgi:hypothetical protein
MAVAAINVVSTTSFESSVKAIVDEGLEKDRHLTLDERAAKFDIFYDSLIDALKPLGTFSEGGFEDADFSSSRYVDPSRIAVISNSVPITTDAIKDIIVRLKQLQGAHVVVFDGIGGQTAIFSDGRVLRSRN